MRVFVLTTARSGSMPFTRGHLTRDEEAVGHRRPTTIRDSRAHGGPLTPDNVRLAHRLCRRPRPRARRAGRKLTPHERRAAELALRASPPRRPPHPRD